MTAAAEFTVDSARDPRCVTVAVSAGSCGEWRRSSARRSWAARLPSRRSE